jgi:hypothetical protein
MFSFSTQFRKPETIYQRYINYKRFVIWKDIDADIKFITRNLLNSGLEDVVSLDAKWRTYLSHSPNDNNNNNNNNNNNLNDHYLSFVVQLIKTYHSDQDRFIIDEDIENI